MNQLISTPSDPRVSFATIAQFSRAVSMARTFITMQQEDDSPPRVLPPAVQKVLAGVMGWDAPLVQQVWELMQADFWAMNGVVPTDGEIYQYNQFALNEETSYRHLFPPTRVCLQCTSSVTGHPQRLAEPRTHKATLFSLREGPLPVYTTSLYCRKCYTRYHSNYRIQSGQRIYYGGVPDVLQVAQHFFIETSLVELFVAGQVFGWISATNWARIYDYALSPRCPHVKNNKYAFPAQYARLLQPQYPNWQSTLSLRPEDVLNSFFLYSLLLDKAEHGWKLILPHDESSQADRLREALRVRNQAMEGVGQEAYPHACDLCCHVIEAEDGSFQKIQAAVCDGNNMGHPCCGIHDCTIPLDRRTDRFCPDHQVRERLCAVDNCTMPVEGRSRTCADPGHKRLEARYFARGTAIMDLQARLKRAGVVVPTDSASLDIEQPKFAGVVEEEECSGKDGGADYSKRKLRACFGTNYTHTELLFMRPCGVILSRATLYGSEAISAVHLAAKATFPTPESTPEYLFYDSNCKLVAHQRTIGDTHFDRTARPVDVFHFRSKHKETDTFCQQHCNPAAFKELMHDGKWRFNSSICEQTNVWLGGYMAILRNMEVSRYNFYLDEMIKRRNRYIIEELTAKDYQPWVIPFDTLFLTVDSNVQTDRP